MAGTTQQTNRSSQETEHRHLLSRSATPSAATSIIDFDLSASSSTPTQSRLPSGTTTPRARSPTPPSKQQQEIPKTATKLQGYRGFPSEAAYIEALKAWAESKKFLEPDVGLQGFYGSMTMDEYAGRPGLSLGVREKWRRRKRKGEKSEGS